ncbi:MAG TPA: ATP-binding protein [Candidatus Dormibacteraeota bacterium]|nr:ATP-binding protein [Candidatus Dormibacteraeota bacterium]
MTSSAKRANLEALSLVSMVCGRIAHDLNNLLAAVDGYAEFVAQDVADRPQALSDIREVRNAAKKGAAFSKRLRQVGQLVEGSPEPLDLSQLAREAEEQVRLIMGDSIEVGFDLSQTLPKVNADAQQVQLALLTMVENACEAMPDGGKLKIDTFEYGEEVALRVTDEGCGMSPEVLGRMYDPFFSTKPKAIGNGLGMFIVAGVVDRAGGRVDVESQEGAGTTITLLLPATRD